LDLAPPQTRVVVRVGFPAGIHRLLMSTARRDEVSLKDYLTDPFQG
jgi:hypothetical protein